MCGKGLHSERRCTGQHVVELLHNQNRCVLNCGTKGTENPSLVQKMAESSGDEGAANMLGGPVTPGPELVACIQRIVVEAMNIASAGSGTSMSRRPGSLADGGTEAGGYPQCIVALWLLKFGRTTHASPSFTPIHVPSIIDILVSPSLFSSCPLPSLPLTPCFWLVQ